MSAVIDKKKIKQGLEKTIKHMKKQIIAPSVVYDILL